ncbi:hypothetical protein [Alkalihalobacillus sp. R86527]|uniref:hypothetical protein n=1 Tax=Alkalihalobacillus sp. R86527 TaxID=3093863 RepID=UPI00366BB90C
MGKKSSMMPLLTAVSVGAALYSVYQNRQPKKGTTEDISNMIGSVIGQQKQ